MTGTQMTWPLPVGYQALEPTVSLCPACRDRVEAVLAERDGAVHVVKQCPVHGLQVELREENAAFFKARGQYTKPGTRTETQTETRRGCPFDCGLCPDHDQHSCIGLIEVNGQCELACPDCYTGRQPVPDLTLDEASRMMDFLQAAEEGRAEILQLSGGEPTLHPAIVDILALAKSKRFKYVLLNSNGLRMAEDDGFVARLSAFLPQFEVYLQYDGREAEGHTALRGRDLRAVKEQAIRKLTAAGIPVTLVATIRRGANDHEIGSILRHAMSIPGIRGVNYQPLAYYGWGDVRDRHDRITLTGVLERLERQTAGEYRLSDFVPLPCNVERVALTYCYRDGERFVPITRRFDVREHLPMITNTLAFDADDYLAKAVSGSALCDCMTRFLSVLRPFIPAGYERLSDSEKADYFNRNLFRISVSSFVDPYNFDLKSMQRECVHVITRDLRRIPFSAYNMFHRTP